MDEFTPTEQMFLDLLLDETKLNEAEWESMFGNDLPDLRRNLTIRRIVAEHKIEKNKAKRAANELKYKEAAQIVNYSLKNMSELLRSSDENIKLRATLKAFGPFLAYFEKASGNKANIDFMEDINIENHEDKLIINFSKKV